MRRFVIVALPLGLAGCLRACGPHTVDDAGSSSSTADAAAVTPETTIESLLPKELADTPPFGNDDKRAVCGKTITGTCDILQKKSAGKDAQGRDLVVVTVRTSEPIDAGGEYPDPENGIEERQHWVIGRKDGVIVFRAPIASERASTDVKVDESLEVGNNEVKLTPADVAPSSWKMAVTYEFRLSPLALLEHSDSEFNSNPSMIGTSDHSIDLRDGSGQGSFHCQTRSGSYLPIPALLAQVSAFNPVGGLGKCAGDVDGTPQHGTIVQGAADRKNGWFRVAYLADESKAQGRGPLYVEVHDDHFTPGDHLELRLGRGASGLLCDVFDTVVKKITVDGTGAVSRRGIIEAKRIVDGPNVRTFEITFAKGFDAWSGFAIDMVDDDGGGATRRLSTAAIGPELGSMSQVDSTTCVDGPDGPVPIPLIKAASTGSLTEVATPPGRIANIVHAWNDAINAHDGAKLGALYANEVELYGRKLTRDSAVAAKNMAFAKHDRDTLSDISVADNRATFRKQSKSKDGSTIWVDGYIDVDASMKITAEGDTTTDENLARKRESDCVAAIDALLSSTPEGQAARKIALREVDDDGPRWTVKYFSQRPGSKKEDNDLVRADEFEIDAAAATIEHDDRPMTAPAAALSKVASACR